MYPKGPFGCDEVFPGSDYADDELEILKAVDRYLRQHRRKFLSTRDFLKVVKSLGYRKVDIEIDSRPVVN